jgi:hypothetical protein
MRAQVERHSEEAAYRGRSFLAANILDTAPANLPARESARSTPSWRISHALRCRVNRRFARARAEIAMAGARLFDPRD